MNYITRKGGATVTVFVPYDCQNHCPFCINKAEYQDTKGFNLDNILTSIKIMSVITPECDFVFTGGEPLADLKTLEIMLNAVHMPETNHKVFINTTLPVNKYSERELADFLNSAYSKNLITGINVSRHLDKYVQESSDEIFKMLNFEARINCVLYNLHLADPKIKEKLINFVERFRHITGYIQFRKDYVVTTPENLYDKENDEIFKLLEDTFCYRRSFGEYRMRVGYWFTYEDYKITYHKTLPYSKLPALYKEGTDQEIPMAIPELNIGTFILYDIIIKQDGTIRDDWDFCSDEHSRICNKIANELDLKAYRNVKFEEYK